MQIYATQAAVSDFNIETLQVTGLSVLQIEVLHTPVKAKSSSDDNTEGLHSELFVSKGCRIMLTSNLLILCELVNGALSTLIDMVWRPEVDSMTTLPCMLLFKPDRYDGPTLFEDHDGKGVVPIFPVQKEWDVGSEKYS